MTFENAALLVIVALLIAIIMLALAIWKQLEVALQRLTHIDNMITEQKPRQHQVASKVGPSQAVVERPKVKQRHKGPLTGKMGTAARLVRKGGASRGDSENDRLRSDPDEVSGPKRKTRWVGGSEADPRREP